MENNKPPQFGYMYLPDINGDGRKDMLTTMAHDYGARLRRKTPWLCRRRLGSEGP